MSSDPRPPATATHHPLPFERLSPADFERLCLWLVEREGYDRAEALGEAGSEQGRDIVAWQEGVRVAFQCKRVRQFGPKSAEAEIKKICRLSEEEQPAELIFVVTFAVSAKTRKAARTAWGDAKTCHFWSGHELDHKVKQHPEIVAEFFDLGGAEPVPRPSRPAEALLKIWLDRVTDAHRELMPYFERRGAPLLEHVYIELQLSLHQRPGLRDRDVHRLEDFTPERLLGRQLSIRQVLDLNPAKDRWVTRRWLLRGDPGSGKTTLLRHLARTLADDGGEPWVPVFESLPRLLRDELWLLDRIERNLTKAGQPGAAIRQALEQRGEAGGLVLLLDGLDEVPHELRDDAEEFLAELARKWRKSPIVVSTRPIGAGSLGPEYRELEVLPFDRDRRRSFLAQWFGHDGEPDTERAAEVAQALETDRGLLELASNPLYLTLIALLVEEEDEPSRHRPKLFDQIFDLLEEGRHKKPPTPIRGRQVAHESLQHLAYQLTEANCDAEAPKRLERRLLEEDRIQKLLKREWGVLRDYLKDVAEKTGILGPHDGEDADWRFWHRTFREGLTAEHLEQIHGEGGSQALCERAQGIEGDLSRWAEPFALVAGRVPEPDQLVLALVEANRDLGLRAVATAQGLQEATLRQILDLSENWMERQKVYERVPELIDDPHRVLALLDKLRRQTRDGNDLFFLERAAVTVGTKWPGAQRAAEQLRGRLYDHIKPPPEDLFRWIETPLDGRVQLWREISAGKFLMGSPEGEQGRYAREGPQHEVRITSPFRISAVPVTVDQYAAFDPEHRSYFQDEIPEDEFRTHPAEQVTWYAAFAFCRWLSASFEWARGARLPTEEEWEYACRAGTQTRFWNGNEDADLDKVGWYGDNSGSRTHRVGEKLANPWGLYDVHGNVFEWTLSEWKENHFGQESGLTVDPTTRAADPAESPRGVRVYRGGCFLDIALRARSAFRGRGTLGPVILGLGFRVLLPRRPLRVAPSDLR